VPSRDRDGVPETPLNIDHALVAALEHVEHAIGVYLAELSQPNLDNLRQVLAELDDRTAASDDWAQSIASAGLWGYGDVHLAIGQTRMTPVIDQEGSSLFHAQIAMVQAAKAVVRHPEPNSVQALRITLSTVEARNG
jgi:hypothetical protein